MELNLPYLTRDLPGIGGKIKEYLDDFRVEEMPLYQPCGKGTHVYFRVLKSGIPTPVAADRIARYMGVHPAEIGIAGLKDSQAITSQMMSLEHADASRLRRFKDQAIRIEDISFHTNKLRIGHLAGNRFVVRIRGVGIARLASAQRILDVLAQRGVPNFFGQQRFGTRGDTALLGRAMVRGDTAEFFRVFLGQSQQADPPDCKAARDAFDAGFMDRALQRWPRHYVDQRRALVAYKRRRQGVAALAAVDKRLKRLYVSAFQSEVFNSVLERRLETFDRVMAGDMAQKSDRGGIFTVEDEQAEQQRAERFEISPTGPIIGYRSNLAGGMPGQIERQVLQEYNVDLEDFRRVGQLRVKGSRRALRFRMESPQLKAGKDHRGEFLELAFTAPPGCYATVILREITKSDRPEQESSEQELAES